MWVNLFPWSCAIQGFVTSNVAQAKERSYRNQHPINQFLPLTIEIFGCLHKHVDVCQCYLELEGAKGPSSFYLGHFFSSKSFDHIVKDASVFHLKLSNSHRLGYFPTSTPSRHTSHHHGWSFASHWFMTYKYGRPTTGSRLWTWRYFHSYFEPTCCPITFPFSLILFLCSFP